MKKVIVLVFFALLLGNLFILHSVSALDRTRVYGTAVANSRITLLADYFANGKQYNQMLVDKADATGNWEHVFLSDIGTITFTLTADGQSKKFTIPSGTPFLASFIEEVPEVINETNLTETEGINVSVQESEPQQTVALSGHSIFEKFKTMDFGTWGIIIILVVLIVIIVLANIFSAVLLKMWRAKGETQNIRVVKLSDKLEEIKQKEQEEKEKIQKEKEDKEKREEQDELEADALQKKIKELESKLQEKKSKDDLLKKIKELEEKLKEKESSE